MILVFDIPRPKELERALSVHGEVRRVERLHEFVDTIRASENWSDVFLHVSDWRDYTAHNESSGLPRTPHEAFPRATHIWLYSTAGRVPWPEYERDKPDNIKFIEYSVPRDHLPQLFLRLLATLDPKYARTPSREYLTAVSVLCQGYLVVYWAANQSLDMITKAIEHMGWDRVNANALQNIAPDLKERVNKVQNNDWWSILLDPEAGAIEGCKTWAEFIDAIVCEIDKRSREELPPAIDDLLVCLESGKGINEPGMVAAAYLAIADQALAIR